MYLFLKFFFTLILLVGTCEGGLGAHRRRRSSRRRNSNTFGCYRYDQNLRECRENGCATYYNECVDPCRPRARSNSNSEDDHCGVVGIVGKDNWGYCTGGVGDYCVPVGSQSFCKSEDPGEIRSSIYDRSALEKDCPLISGVRRWATDGTRYPISIGIVGAYGIEEATTHGKFTVSFRVNGEWTEERVFFTDSWYQENIQRVVRWLTARPEKMRITAQTSDSFSFCQLYILDGNSQIDLLKQENWCVPADLAPYGNNQWWLESNGIAPSSLEVDIPAIDYEVHLHALTSKADDAGSVDSYEENPSCRSNDNCLKCTVSFRVNGKYTPPTEFFEHAWKGSSQSRTFRLEARPDRVLLKMDGYGTNSWGFWKLWMEAENVETLIAEDSNGEYGTPHGTNNDFWIYSSGGSRQTEFDIIPAPTRSPTLTPTTSRPTSRPTGSPLTPQPTHSPVTPQPTHSPLTSLPTFSPTTSRPTVTPSLIPTTPQPSNVPTTPQPTLVPTNVPTVTPSTPQPSNSPSLAPTCVDEIGWKDVHGDDCTWYQSSERCALAQEYINKKGMSASEACCFCRSISFPEVEDLDSESISGMSKKSTSEITAWIIIAAFVWCVALFALFYYGFRPQSNENLKTVKSDTLKKDVEVTFGEVSGEKSFEITVFPSAPKEENLEIEGDAHKFLTE